MIVLLDNIRSAHNVGSMFRTADAAGIEKIYLCGITPAPIDRFGRTNKEIAKVALGAEKTVAWEAVKSTAAVINKLKKEGFAVFAVEQDARSIPYDRIRLKKQECSRTAILMGAEVEGVSRAILKRCDAILEIPMRGEKESLNVSVAFGIVVFQLIRGLRK